MMTRDELMIEVLSRHGKNKYYSSSMIFDALSSNSHSSFVGKIRKLRGDEKFINQNFIARFYNDEANNRRVYYDITKAGVMLLLLKQQKDDFRISLIKKLIALL